MLEEEISDDAEENMNTSQSEVIDISNDEEDSYSDAIQNGQHRRIVVFQLEMQEIIDNSISQTLIMHNHN